MIFSIGGMKGGKSAVALFMHRFQLFIDKKKLPYEVVPSGHGGALIAHEGFLYRKKNSRKSTSNWCCVEARCPGRACLYHISCVFFVSREHDHSPKPDIVRRRKLMALISSVTKLTLDRSAEAVVASLGEPDLSPSEIDYLTKYVVQQRAKAKRGAGKPRTEMKLVKHNYDVIPSHRNRAVIVKDGYTFRQLKGVKKKGEELGDIYWTCFEKACKVRARTCSAGTLRISSMAHAHPPQAPGIADEQIRNKLKEAAYDLTQPLVEILANFEVEDLMTKRFLRYVREQQIKKSELEMKAKGDEEEEAEDDDEKEENSDSAESEEEEPREPVTLPLDVSVPDINEPSCSLPSDMLSGFESVSVENAAESYGIDDILNRMDDII